MAGDLALLAVLLLIGLPMADGLLQGVLHETPVKRYRRTRNMDRA